MISTSSSSDRSKCLIGKEKAALDNRPNKHEKSNLNITDEMAVIFSGIQAMAIFVVDANLHLKPHSQILQKNAVRLAKMRLLLQINAIFPGKGIFFYFFSTKIPRITKFAAFCISAIWDSIWAILYNSMM